MDSMFAHSGKFSNIPMSSGDAEAGSVLSFAASVYGFATGWTRYFRPHPSVLSTDLFHTCTLLFSTSEGLVFVYQTSLQSI